MCGEICGMLSVIAPRPPSREVPIAMATLLFGMPSAAATVAPVLMAAFLQPAELPADARWFTMVRSIWLPTNAALSLTAVVGSAGSAVVVAALSSHSSGMQ